MSFENEEQRSPSQHNEITNESQKKSKILYTRKFLLSLSDLEVCQKLPVDIDQSILSEFEDNTYDRQRASGNLSSNSFRRSDYGPSPPSRGDLTNHSWGDHGRWESRSSGKSDKDSDSQSDWDSESGRRYGNQSRRSQQAPEHDGLLGSGSFPRPSGYSAGVSTPKFRPNEHYQLNKSNEPYHPPRPYKVPHSRHSHDSYNDETFGSSESTSEDRVEEERKRRESFELMRQEHHKAFQEKQKFNTEIKKDVFDITTLLDDSKGVKRTNRSNEPDESAPPPTSDSSSEKSSFLSQTTASRPVVPPGFAGTILDKNLAAKSLNHPYVPVPGESVANLNPSSFKNNSAFSGSSGNQEQMQLAEDMGLSLSKKQDENMTSHASIHGSSENILLNDSNKMIGAESNLHEKANLSEASNNSETIEVNVGKMAGKSNKDSTSVLDKLFGSTLALNGGGSSSLFEKQDSKADDTWSPHTVESSKFAHLFHEEEKKPTNDLTPGKPNDLLSLIVGGEKDGLRVLGINEYSSPKFPYQSFVPHDKLASNLLPAEQMYTNNKPKAVSAVLTCEDLEQSILLEIGDNGSALQPSVQSLIDPDGKTEHPKASIDDVASQHILSLLQKGTCLKDLEFSQKLDATSVGKLNEIKGASTGTASYESRDANVEKGPDSANILTLETLFGTAFMKELQSVGAPVSVQKAPGGSMSADVSEPLGLGSPVVNTSQLLFNQGSKGGGGFDAPADVCLPEEDSLISVSDPLNVQNLVRSGSSVKTELLSFQTARGDVSEKLSALNSVFKDGRHVRGSQEQSFLHGPYDASEPDMPYQNFNVQLSSAQFHHPQIHNVGSFHPLDSHPVNMNSQMKFMASEAILHHDPLANHQFPANILRPAFHHPNPGFSGIDQPVHHPMLQQMHRPSILPPHLLQGMSRGPSPPHPNQSAALPAYANSQVTGYMQEVNSLPGFTFGHRQPNFGSLGMPQPVPDVGGGSNHPEAFQRLMEMELRSNAKQIRPYAAGGHNQGMYGHELDMRFGYR